MSVLMRDDVRWMDASKRHSMRARVLQPSRAAMLAPAAAAGRRRAQPPTHFVGLRLTSQPLQDAFASVHSELLKFDAALAPTLVPAVRLRACLKTNAMRICLLC
jgi:hypothetical protein